MMSFFEFCEQSGMDSEAYETKDAWESYLEECESDFE